jgi:hypothetical protein
VKHGQLIAELERVPAVDKGAHVMVRSQGTPRDQLPDFAGSCEDGYLHHTRLSSCEFDGTPAMMTSLPASSRVRTVARA